MEHVQSYARAFATRLAHRPDDIDDLVQVGLLAYHKYLTNRGRHEARNPRALVGRILVCAMKGFYVYSYPKKNIFRRTREQEWKMYSPLLAVSNAPSSTDNQAEMFELDDYFRALEERCGRTARVLAENLVLVQNECIAGYVLSESARKVDAREKAVARLTRQRLTPKQIRKRARTLPRGGGKRHSIRISPQLIGEAMALKPWQLRDQMQRIRQFTSEWFGLDAARTRAES